MPIPGCDTSYTSLPPVQRDIVASLHEQLASDTEQLQQEAQEWQSQCTSMEKELVEAQAKASAMQQELKTRPTNQQVHANALWPLHRSGQQSACVPADLHMRCVAQAPHRFEHTFDMSYMCLCAHVTVL